MPCELRVVVRGGFQAVYAGGKNASRSVRLVQVLTDMAEWRHTRYSSALSHMQYVQRTTARGVPASGLPAPGG